MYSLKKSIKRNVNAAILLISRGQRVNQLKVGNSNKASWLCWQDMWSCTFGTAVNQSDWAWHCMWQILLGQELLQYIVQQASKSERSVRPLPLICVVLGCFLFIRRLSFFLCKWGWEEKHPFHKESVNETTHETLSHEWSVVSVQPRLSATVLLLSCPPSVHDQSFIPQSRTQVPWTRTGSSGLTTMPVPLIFLRRL